MWLPRCWRHSHTGSASRLFFNRLTNKESRHEHRPSMDKVLERRQEVETQLSRSAELSSKALADFMNYPNCALFVNRLNWCALWKVN